jgi:hypothetical protein
LLGTFLVPSLAGDQTFSFLGVSFPTAVISRVRVIAGNTALGAGVLDQNGDPQDLVVADDFLYGEPIPEPTTPVLMAFALGALMLLRLRRFKR